nr:MAG TPA: hypothetical protein [Caudoviricetes sp.]
MKHNTQSLTQDRGKFVSNKAIRIIVFYNAMSYYSLIL